MTVHTIRLIAAREYLKVVRKKSFWLMVLLLPTFYIVVSVVSGTSSQTAQKKIIEQAKAANRIIVVDETGLIIDGNIVKPLERMTDVAQAEAAVRDGQADAAIVYPSDITTSHRVISYVKDSGIVSRGRFDELAVNLLKQSILSGVNDTGKIELFNTKLQVARTVYADGKPIVTTIEAFILPILAVIVYFLLVMTSSSYMLMSVSEEKENRMIETVLSIVKPRQLIWGKLWAMVGLSFTQLAVLAAYGTFAYKVTTKVLPFSIDWGLVDIGAWQLVLTSFFVIAGFIVMAALMVGIGAAMPTYREAQQASPLFIIFSILPVYFAMVLIAEPSGTVAKITSYVPLMSPLILTFRMAIDALPAWEQVIGIVVSLVYVVGGMYFAFALFEFGSLETSRKVSFTSMFRRT